MSIPQATVQRALRHLRRADPVLRDVIRRVGPFQLKLQRDRFAVLVRSIISQQISTAAARTIRARLEGLVAPEPTSPENLLNLTDAKLKAAGVSPQKLSYIRDLCAKVSAGEVTLRTIGRKSDEAVIKELTQIRGIGRWTAQMFLMFSLGRLDVLPHDDLGIRSNIRTIYGIDEMPSKAVCEELAAPWRPYTSIACWYCWRHGDLE